MENEAQTRLNSTYASRYELLELLGEGGMGAVYRARHTFTGGEVALKVMHAGVVRSEHAQGRFLREAQAPKTIDHPGIVKVSDAGVAEDGSLYLAMELLEGEDLASALERRPLNAQELGAVVTELLDCLAAAHASGLVHRDIKPENVFLVRGAPTGKRVKLLDFGITKQLDEERDQKLTQTGLVVGTPHYMSPEQARGNPADARSDVYSVGALLFFGLTGRPPFVQENYNRLIIALATESAPQVRSVRDDVPAALATIVDRALEMSAEQRFQSAAEMRDALAVCSGLEGMEAPTIQSIAYEATLASGIEPGRPPSADFQNASVPIARTLATPAGSFAGHPAVGTGAESMPGPGASSGGRGKLLVIGALVAVAAGGAVAFGMMKGPADQDSVVNTEPPDGPSEPSAEVAGVDEAVEDQRNPPNVDPGPDVAVEETEELSEETDPDVTQRLEELEEQLAAVEREKKARRIAQRRLLKQRAQEAEEAQRRQRAGCQAACQMTLATCNRQTGGRGKAASDCHMQWSACLRGCRN